jgi:hypothetical protein
MGIANLESKVVADAAKVKAWYKAYPFYAGLVVGAIATVIIRHFL